MMPFLDYVWSIKDQIISLSWEHVELTLFSVLLAILIGVPLGILISYLKKLTKPILGLANIVQAIPSLALLGFAIPFLGIGSKPAVFMVILYSLLPIIKNTYTGIQSIPSQTIEAATGIGMTRAQILMKVQIPMALPIIMAGVRISAVTAVGLMTIAAFIGAGGLGYLVYSGIRTSNNMQILAGAIPACILALLIDTFMGFMERVVVPEGLAVGNSNVHKPIRKTTKIIVGIVAACLVIVSAGNQIFSSIKKADALVIGSSDMSEQLILANMYADMIEEKTDYTVERKLSLGGVQICFAALQNNEIDMYVDYTGTLYGDILKMKSNTDAKEVYETAKVKIKEKYDMNLLDQTPFNDTYTFTVRKDTAEKYNLKTVSDLEKVSKKLIITPTLAFNNRKEALPGVSSKYPDMKFKDNIAMDGATRYVALQNKESDVIDAYSTDGLISYYDLVVLEDDKHYFLPYYGVPLVNNKMLEEYPDAVTVINELSSHLSSEKMRDLNYEVDVEKKEPADVAHAFLVTEGLLAK